VRLGGSLAPVPLEAHPVLLRRQQHVHVLQQEQHPHTHPPFRPHWSVMKPRLKCQQFTLRPFLGHAGIKWVFAAVAFDPGHAPFRTPVEYDENYKMLCRRRRLQAKVTLIRPQRRAK